MEGREALLPQWCEMIFSYAMISHIHIHVRRISEGLDENHLSHDNSFFVVVVVYIIFFVLFMVFGFVLFPSPLIFAVDSKKLNYVQVMFHKYLYRMHKTSSFDHSSDFHQLQQITAKAHNGLY